MPSSTEQPPSTPETVARVGSLAIWNRKFHYYLGLYLLLFLWLFAFTGLLLNHQWKFAEFWDARKTTNLERDIVPPRVQGDLAQARDLMLQLHIRGEIEWTSGHADARQLNFRVSRPGHILEIRADLDSNKATIQRIDLNGWGVARILHTFTGVRLDDTSNTRDWIATWVWAIAMDAVAVGMIVHFGMNLTGFLRMRAA